AVLFAYTLAPVVLYNAEMFDELGIQVPEDRDMSVDQFLEIVDALDDAGVEGLGVGGNTSYHLHHLAMGLLGGAATDAEMEQYLTNYSPEVDQTVDYSTGPYMAVVLTLVEWNEAGVFPNGMLSQDYTQAESAFVAGQSGMFLGGSWTPGELTNDLSVEFEVDWFRAPSTTGQGNQLQLFSGDMFVIPTGAQNIDEAKSFLEFAMAPEQQASLVRTGTLLPIVTDVPDDALAELNPLTASIVEDAATNGSIEMWGPMLPIEIGQEFGVRQYQSLMAGTTTPEEVARAFDEALAALRNE